MHRDDDGNEYGFHGVFHGEPSPDGMRQTFEFEGAPGHVSLDTLTLEERDGRTIVRDPLGLPVGGGPRRDGRARHGRRACNEGFDRLDELLARLAPGPIDRHRGETPVDYTLELVVVPVTDVDRAKAFYASRCGFVVESTTAPATTSGSSS